MQNCAQSPKQNRYPEKGRKALNRYFFKEITYQPDKPHVHYQAEKPESHYSEGRGQELQYWFDKKINQTQDQSRHQQGFIGSDIYSGNELNGQPES